MRSIQFLIFFLAIGVATLQVSPARAFFFPFGFGGTGGNGDSKKTLNIEFVLPYFSESRWQLVARVNPDSEALADPVVRWAALSVLNMATRGLPEFPLDVFDRTERLSWLDPGQTVSAYRIAEEEFGGPDMEIVMLAEKAGLISQGGSEPLPEIEIGAAEGGGTLRRVLRQLNQSLQQAGYHMNSDGMLTASDGKTLQVYVKPAGGGITPEQIGAIQGMRRFGGMVGIDLRLQSPEDLSKSSLSTTDILLTIEAVNSSLGFVTRLRQYNELGPIKAFIDAVPKKLSASQQITSLAILDKYLVDAQYVLPIAHLPSERDITTAEGRYTYWKPMLADRYIKHACIKTSGVEGYIRTGYGYHHRQFPHPLIILLPEQGGSEEVFGIQASMDQIPIEDRGVLVFSPTPPQDGTEGKSIAEAAVEIPVRRDGSRSLLIIERPDVYLQLAEKNAENRAPFKISYRILEGTELGDVQEIDEEAGNRILTEELKNHKFSSGIVQCARHLAASDEELTFGPAGSIR